MSGDLPLFAGEKLAGTVRSEVFRSAEGGFAVLRVETDSGETVTITGALPPACAGETLEAEGEWVTDPRFGRQFQARQASLAAPRSKAAVLRYLASGSVSGIGEELARRIVEKFGEKAIELLDNSPQDLLKVRGIGKKKLAGIKASWQEQRASREVMLYLRGHGLGPVMAQRIHRKYGAEARQLIDEDPYRLARDVDGVGFLTADRLASSLGIQSDDPRRLRAGLLHAAEEALKRGDTASPVSSLLERAAQTLRAPASPGALEQPLLNARQAGDLELEQIGSEPHVYLPRLLRAERNAARRTVEIVDSSCRRRVAPIDADKALAWVAGQSDLRPSADQVEAIRAALEAPLVVITGGPGVGKTTIVRALVDVLRSKRVRFALAAPTGRAARRLEEATGERATTIHRLLEWAPREGFFARNHEQPLDLDLLVVDEASMVDVRLYHALVRALPPGASLVMTGDVDQLPSVGPGAVLADLIASGAARVVRLTEVFRQAARSKIVSAAHAINQGAMPNLSGDPEAGDDFFFVARNEPVAAREMIVRLVQERIPSRFGLDPFREIQVLSPMRKGACGTEALNRALKQALLPNSQADKLEFLATGDKVMQLKNDYDNEVFNGDVGRVLERDPDGSLTVSFDGRHVHYGRAQSSQLALSYCATIHKSQGSEYPAVVLPVLTEHHVMLQRNLIYTAITRARKLVVLVGQRRAIEAAVKNNSPRLRVSFLGQRICSLVGVQT